MKLHDLRPPKGAKKERKRVARGNAGKGGTYAGRGRKGQNARAGKGVPPYFEGGQLPLVRRLPHLRGFTNIWKVYYTPVNVERLTVFEPGSIVTPERMAAAGLLRSADEPVVILGQGELDRPLTVCAHRFSASARAKITAAGGTVSEIPLRG
ncbi:MAG: 50S ribosomal protein L15 [Anaerolineae bacterium]|nr:50S ribosomal protein L15 [Anaerolineae bacterium]MDW8100097.1 50S ribosomal protein L15 [Anaerolineae bacterium]